jgi:type III restriction enzyme
LNDYEYDVACYLDEQKALRWWHRNVAKAQVGYSLQGWKKQKFYPDFIFALARDNGSNRMVVLETKGDHLNNPDTAYKKKLMEICTGAFKFEPSSTASGELELISDDGTTVSCSLIFQNNWNTELSSVIAAD